MTERFRTLTDADMSPAQRAARDGIIAGPRGGVPGPFTAMLHSAGLADTAQRVGAHIRYASSLPQKLTELVILVVARHWRAQYEWWAHHRLALQAGLDPAIGEAIRTGAPLPPVTEDEALVVGFAESLLRQGAVTDAQFEAVKARFGEAGAADLIGTVGYYCLVSFVLNVDRVTVPDGTTPLPEL